MEKKALISYFEIKRNVIKCKVSKSMQKQWQKTNILYFTSAGDVQMLPGKLTPVRLSTACISRNAIIFS